MPSIGLSIIVKNGAETLRSCVESVRPLVEQVVVVDTGSTDGTLQIACGLGAELYEIEWPNNFAAARNFALDRMRTDWVLVLDDDEELDKEAIAQIPLLLQNNTVGGYIAPIRTYFRDQNEAGAYAMCVKPNDGRHSGAETANRFLELHLCRLFRRHPSIRFQGRIHEVVDSTIALAGLALKPADFIIHHFGNLAGQGEAETKAEFYRNLLRLKCEDEPESSKAWFEFGQFEVEHFKNYSSGIACLIKATQLKGCSPLAYLSLAKLQIDAGDNAGALKLMTGVRMEAKSAAEKDHLCGDALYNLKELRQAREHYARALKVLRNDSRVESKLGLTEVRLGIAKSGFAKLQHAIKVSPDSVEAHDRMIKACIVADRMEEAAEAAEQMAHAIPHPKVYLRAASIRAQLNQMDEALCLLAEGRQFFPEDEALRQAEAQLCAARV